MREIKFRAWGYNGKTEKQEMFYDYKISFQNTGINTILKDMQENVVTLMQFTGLHDKNGKEIYEGDVVRHGKGEYEPFQEAVSVVEWFDLNLEYIFRKHHIKKDDKDPQVWDTERLANAGGGVADMPEVIGNIYENPELIEKQNE